MVRPSICVPEPICVLYVYFSEEHTIRFRPTNRGSYPIPFIIFGYNALSYGIFCSPRRGNHNTSNEVITTQLPFFAQLIIRQTRLRAKWIHSPRNLFSYTRARVEAYIYLSRLSENKRPRVRRE